MSRAARSSLIPLLLLIACGRSAASTPDARADASSREELLAEAQPVAPPVPEAGRDMDLRARIPANRSAYIPPQCYADTRGEAGRVHNPCHACHHDAWRPNFIGDGSVQEAYDLPEPALANPWTNLRVDRREAIEQTPPEETLAWVRSSNYRKGDELLLASTLGELPPGWDDDGDGAWDGYVPDAWLDFDDRGFDRGPDGALSGWRTYGYRPLPGAFFPTNGGSWGDALIRLPERFRRDEEGRQDLEVYATNLAILEALITRTDVPIAETDERTLHVDLDGDGVLGKASRIHFRWAPLKGETMSWVGQARLEQERGEVQLAAGLFPVGTELLHSVRYLDVDAHERVVMAPRMKELRYARKRRGLSYAELDEAAAEDGKERADFPARVREPAGDVEHGVDNGMGWLYQGFIEDRRGDLRPQSVEETIYCVGCHSGVGATDDGVFSFARKLGADAPASGWFHAGTDNGYVMGDSLRADGRREYGTYLRVNGAGDDFRANDELLARFFDDEGQPLEAAIDALADDARPLLLPSPERALLLGAAYRLVVDEQSFVRGRDAVLAPPAQLLMEVAGGMPTGVAEPTRGPRDRRLVPED